jgi:fatty-acyl-CoA synthase
MFMFTSGTTSRPKAAILSHEAITRQFTNMAATCFLLTPDDKVWNALTFYHIGGIVFTFCCFAVGATCVHSGNFDAGVALKQLEDERCTVALPGFEVFWQSLIDHPDFSAKKLGPLRLINGMGVPERRRQLQAAFPGVTTITTFGATEACSFITSLRPGDPYEARMETLGSAMPGMEVRIRDLDGTGDAAPGVVGEILYRGPTLFDGYYGAPELTRQAIDCEGWFHSGDLGDLNAEGRLTFRGRLKDMLKVGGENVSPLEVEEFLSTHPAVLVAQVIGVPDAYYDEVPAAYLQLRPGMTVTVEDIISFCLGSIATFKIPRYVRVVEDWPMSATKIKKASLREELTAELEKAGIKQAPKITSRGAAKA